MEELKKSINILICEDVYLNFFVLEQLIRRANSNVLITHAVDGVEGTNLFDKGTFDLIKCISAILPVSFSNGKS